MSPPCLLCIPMHSLIMRNRSGSSCLGCRKCWASAAKAERPTRIVPTVRAPISVFISANSGAKADMAARRMRANSGLLLRVALARSQCFGCTRLVRLLDELVNPRLEHLAELLVEGIAEGAAGAGEDLGACAAAFALGSLGWAGGALGRTASARGAFPAHRGVGAAAALARRRLLMNAAGARSLRRAGLGFRLRLSALARGGGLLLVALRACPGGRLYRLGGLVPRPVAAPRAIIVARGCGLEPGLGLLEDREEEERLRGAWHGPPSRRGWPRRRPQHRRSGACACGSSIVGNNELLNRVTRAAARLCELDCPFIPCESALARRRPAG